MTFYKIFGFPLQAISIIFVIIHIHFKDVNNHKKNRSLEPLLQGSTNTEVQFVLRETHVGGSNTESLINHLKSKHRIHVIFESEDQKSIPAQEEIRSQIVKKEMNLFEATKKRSSNVEKSCSIPWLQSSPNQWKQRRLFQPLDYLSQNSETHWMMEVCFDCHTSVLSTSLKNCANLIDNSLINCAGTNSSNFAMISNFTAQNRLHFKIRKNINKCRTFNDLLWLVQLKLKAFES